jgi:hypothetical protein
MSMAIVMPQTAHANYFNYPCNYPFVGTNADVNVIADVGGQYCDGPTEINWTHYHCWTFGATFNIGALAFAPVAGPLSVGGFGGNGLGGSGGQCRYVCPDGMIAPFPNPPAAWIKHLVLDPKNNDCVGHEGIIGDTSTPNVNELPGNIPPGQDAPDGVAVPVAPGALPPGEHNPDAKPGPAPPVPPLSAPGPSGPPMPAGHPVIPNGEEPESPLTPGSPMAIP